MIIGTTGRLGKGKTLSGVIEAYKDYCEGKKIFSNMWLDFEHLPIKTPYDFIDMNDGFFLGDELWHMADNRKSMSLLSDVVTILLLRSRHRDFDVFYTQQFLQIDIRIRYITDYWIKPNTIPNQPVYPEKPIWLIQNIIDAEGKKLAPRKIECKPYLNLFSTKRDAYTLETIVSEVALKKILQRALSSEPNLKEDLKDLEREAKDKIKTKVLTNEDMIKCFHQ